MREARAQQGGPRLLGAGDDLLVSEDELTFPAGVVALGRGGVGDLGALRLPDGELAAFLELAADEPRGPEAVAALARALPGMAAQFLTVRRPIEFECQARAWRESTATSPEHAALLDVYLPRLRAAGWSETRGLLVLFANDAETLRYRLESVAATLPVAARPAGLADVKALVGGWFDPLARGQVAIGWAVEAVTASPPPDWASTLLAHPALTELPVYLTLHLGPRLQPHAPAGAPLRRELAALERRVARRLRCTATRPAPDTHALTPPHDLLATRRALLTRLANAGGDGAAPRPARLLLACVVAPGEARRVRAEVELALRELGFSASAIGPARGYPLLLSCAPLGRPLLGESLLLSEPGVALLAPLAATPPARTGTAVPLGLRRDGGAVAARPGESLLIVGDHGRGKTTAAQTWALARLAAGATVTVIDTTDAWSDVTRLAGGETIAVATRTGQLLGGLDFDSVHAAVQAGDRRRLERWVTETATLLADLAPALSEDERGDVVATLLALADDHLAGRDLVHLHRLVRRLPESGCSRVAGALAAPGTHAPADSARSGEGALGLTVYLAVPRGNDSTGPGLGALAVRDVTRHLRARNDRPERERIIVVDDLTTVLAARSGPAFVRRLLHEAGAAGVAIWGIVPDVDLLAGRVGGALRELRPAGVLFPGDDARWQGLAHWFRLPPAVMDGLAPARPGDALIVRGTRYHAVRIVPHPALDRQPHSMPVALGA